MPDVLGDIYEGALGASLLTLSEWRPCLAPPRPSATCRAVCEHSEECCNTGIEPSIDVDPDLIATSEAGQELVAFITHWRTTGFEKKFWRTSEEIFEYLIHKPEAYGLNYVAEPISQSENLRVCLGKLAGNSIDLPENWNADLSNAVKHFEDEIVPHLQPLSPRKALEYFIEERANDVHIENYLRELEAELLKTMPVSEAYVEGHRLRNLCIEARRRSSEWNLRNIDTQVRTPTQLLSLCLYALEEAGICLSENEYSKGYVRLTKRGLQTVHALARVPFRVQGTNKRPFLKIVKTLTGETLYFDENAFPAHSRTKEILELAQIYLAFLKRHPIWRSYLRRLCLQDTSDWEGSETIQPDGIQEVVSDVVLNRRSAWRLDLLLNAARLSRVGLGATLEQSFQQQFGISVRRLAPFGDEAKNVIAYCVRGESNLLKALPGRSQVDTLRLLVERFSEFIRAGINSPLPLQDILLSMQTKDMRTYLSGAPHPILGAVEALLDDVALNLDKNIRVGTVFTDWHGGNTGRTVYQFRIKSERRNLFIKVSTGQDGNEGHKWKEVAARLRAHRLASAEVVSAWLILDGTWTDDAVRKLYEAGYQRIFSVADIPGIADQIREWCNS